MWRELRIFVKTDLVRKISTDLLKLRIVNEAELEANVYLHLRQFLRKDKSWSIRVQKYITKTSYGNKSVRYFPDIVLERRKPRVVIELKERPSLRKKYIRGDAKKIYKLRKLGQIRKGIILYLFRNKKEKTEKQWQREVTSWLPPRYRTHVTCICINAYDHIPSKYQAKWVKQWRKKSKRQF